ncbi:MAG: chemotaxis protein CheR, partial [Selenomonadaceae bacterium]|nr:chemotaxis protein CheR [Selenomonadaceae bacterium]
MDEKDWAEFKKKLKAKTEIDLDLYKEPQMKRRIGNLVTRSTVKTYTEYFDMVSKNKDDFAEFIEYLTINVSEFFRTPEKFSKLETDVIPDLLTRSSRLNIWSAGCSIGAEPYSLSIIMKEMTPNVRHRILASDLDIEILAKAKKGVYMENEIKAMTPERKKKYFDVVDGKYAVKQEIKSAI